MAAALILVVMAAIAFALLPMRGREPTLPPEPVSTESSTVLGSPSLSGEPALGRADGSSALPEARRAALAALYAPRPWRDALREASAPHRQDGLEHERQYAWGKIQHLCLLDHVIERGTSQRVRRALETAEGRQSLVVVRNAAAAYCEGFDPAVEDVRLPFLEPLQPVIAPDADFAAALATADSPIWYGRAIMMQLDRAVLPDFEQVSGLLAYSASDQRRIRHVATLKASCTIFPLNCGPGGLMTIAECSFDNRCRPGATAPQIMAERYGLDARQQALAIGLGYAMAADYARRRVPGGS